MTAASERMYAQRTILEYLRSSRDARRTTRDIHLYLLENTDWGKTQLRKGLRDLGKQNMDKWIRSMHKSPEFCDEIGWEEDPEDKKQYLYRAKARPPKTKKMPIEEACFLGLAEKFLDVVLPANIDTSMRELFYQARNELRGYRDSPDKKKQLVNAYINRIDTVSRGLELFRDKVPYEVMAELSRAILEEKCVKFKYKGSSKFRIFHPYGIVIREPKIYLLAVEDNKMRSKGAHDPEIIQLLCNRIRDPAVTGQFNRVPDSFKTKTFIDSGGMEVEVPELKKMAKRGFTLELLMHEGNDNLRRDLEEYPISRQQTVEDVPGTNNFLVTAKGMRASHQLVEWILGRADRAEVRSPARLRRYIADRIEKMHRRYAENR